MKAVILAAGEGRRLRPFTETMPKVMLPIANKPVLEYVLDAVKNSGIEEIIVVVGYKKEIIMEHFKEYAGAKITYVVQDKQLGTAHAVLQAKKYIKDTFLVLSGDNLIDQKSILKLKNEKSEYALLIKEHPHPSKYGVVFVEKNILTDIVEKPQEEVGKFISTGIYKLPKSIFTDIEEMTSRGIYALTTVVQSLIRDGKKVQTVAADLWKDVVYPWDILQVNETLMQKTHASIGGVIEKDVTLKGAVSIGKDTTIYAGSYIVGPVVIGEGCEIGPNACIFPSTTIGNNCTIHPFSEIRNSIIMDDTHVGSHSSLNHSIVARGCRLGTNFSAIPGKTTMEVEGEFKKVDILGALIGEDSTIGSTVIIEPGITIGRRCEINSLKRISKNIPSETKVM
jgi:UDP-N-acetylglucosamine diphosphorylase / glucose-1-phosphate thymidylyltransferase / UDP-N-acetylgalactosamine diphosphorylase / glucosamine-1-phosphate N-acetyltransferase / galactosamine-1-phosphate N-acetyltransferase